MTGPAASRESAIPSSTVVVCTYTDQRWKLLKEAISSIVRQSHPPDQIIVCIDHNEQLLARCRQEFASSETDSRRRIEVIANRYDGHLGSARNTATESARGDIMAFMDDDARAEHDWLQSLLDHYAEPSVVAVGGAPLPVYEVPRPRWFPEQMNWVFGCAYDGLPTAVAPVRRVIGANMSVRRKALQEIGGFHSDDHDDMDMSHHLAHAFPTEKILYDPDAVVRHFVSRERMMWRYFWRRCYFVNKSKVHAFSDMGSAANLRADIEFVAHGLSAAARAAVSNALTGDLFGLVRLGVVGAGIMLSAAGNLVGRLERTRIWSSFRQP